MTKLVLNFEYPTNLKLIVNLTHNTIPCLLQEVLVCPFNIRMKKSKIIHCGACCQKLLYIINECTRQTMHYSYFILFKISLLPCFMLLDFFLCHSVFTQRFEKNHSSPGKCIIRCPSWVRGCVSINIR